MAELSLMSIAVNKFEQIVPVKQQGEPGVMLSKRSPEDSRLDPNKTIAEQFNLIRVADSIRYPSFFELLGKRYLVYVEKDKHE
jgi:methionyl-tRNA formyltransferase